MEDHLTKIPMVPSSSPSESSGSGGTEDSRGGKRHQRPRGLKDRSSAQSGNENKETPELNFTLINSEIFRAELNWNITIVYINLNLEC